MNRPLISIVLPTYNRSGTIQNAIRSIIDQTIQQWELIIVDDGSTDGTKRVVESFADPRIFYHKIPHGGIAKARNFGNQHARADIIVVQDSDDMSLPDRLEEFMNTMEDPKVDIAYHGIYLRAYDPYHDAIARDLKPAKPFDKDEMIRSQYIPGHVAYRKKRILETPYDESMSSMDDFQMLIEFALKNYTFQPIFKTLYEYVSQVDSNNILSERDGRRETDTRTLLKLLKDKYGLDMHATLLHGSERKDIL